MFAETPTLFIILSIVVALWKFGFFASIKERFFSSKEEEEEVPPQELLAYRKVLNEHVPFFKGLGSAQQQMFLQRLHRYISEKRIVGMDEFDLTMEAKVLAVAPAVQLTFGLDDYLIERIKTIGIYPDIFWSEMIRREVKGLTFGTGVMYLSYPHLLEGFNVEGDNLNLGLHEWGHALKLWIDNDFREEDELYEKLYEIDSRSEQYREQIQDGEITFLREYAAANEQEFFAVCVEHFFEMPAKFKEVLPGLYKHFVNLLGQDPSNSQVPVTPLAEPLKTTGWDYIKKATNNSWHWSLNLFFIGIFFGWAVTIYQFHQTRIDFLLLMLLTLLVVGPVGYYLYKVLVPPGLMTNLQFGGFLVIGIVPSCSAAFLLSNSMFASAQPAQTYEIVSTYHLTYSPSFHYVVLKDNALTDFEIAREIKGERIYLKDGSTHYWYVTMARGFWGFDVFRESTPYFDTDGLDMQRMDSLINMDSIINVAVGQ